MDEKNDNPLRDRAVNRRRLLRRAGTVAVGVAGAGVASAVVATPAEAAAGAFDSDTLGGPAVVAVNPATGTESAGSVLTVGPQLQLSPGGQVGHMISEQAPVGSIAMDSDGFLWVVTGTEAFKYRDFIHTTGNSNLTVNIDPIRVFDTDEAKMPGGRSRILNPSGAFNGNKLKAQTWVFLDLTDLVKWGFGVFCTAVVVTPAYGGHLTVGPYVSRTPPTPTWSSVNYNAGLTTSGLIFTGIGGEVNATDITTDVIAIYSYREVRVLIDVYGFVVDSAGRVGGTSGTGLLANGQGLAATRQAQVAQYAPKV